MTQRSRWAIPRLARVAAAWVAAVVLGAGVLAAQGTSGKIEGTVRDQSGAPLNGAQVFIVGTAFAAVSNERGYYFINNVPAGTYTVRGQYIGYAPGEVRQVRVFAGQTMTINIPLEQRAIEVSGVTVTVEQTPIVPRDQVASKAITQGDVIQALPVDNIGQMLRLQPGVVEGRTGQTIRGGRPGEAATYIDGVLVRNLTGTTSGVSVGTNAIEEASVTTGAIGAEYGDAQSGVINLVTRAGGQRIRGNVLFATDDPAGQVYGTGLNRLEASLGGPLPVRGLTWFVATTLQGQQNGRRAKGAEDIPSFVLDGIDTTVTVSMAPNTTGAPTDSQVVDLPRFTRYSQGSRLRNAWSSNYSVDSKLQYSFGAGSRLSFTYHYTGGVGMNTGNTYNTMANTAGWNGSSAFILNWTQNLFQGTERALFVDATISYQKDQTITSSVNPEWIANHQKPFMWFSLAKPDFLFDQNTWPVDDRLIQNVRLGNCTGARDAEHPDLGACIPFLNRDDLNTSALYRFSPYGTFATTTGVGGGGPTLSRESRFTGRANFDWQANRTNRVHFGGDFYKTNLNYFTSGSTLIFMDVFKESPSRFGLFAADRIDLGDVVIDLGIRYDRMDSHMQYTRAPGRTFNDPIRTGDLSTAFTAEDTLMAQRCGTLYAAVTAGGTPADTTAWSTCNYFNAPAHEALSPRIGVSFPVTDKTGFRLSYAHQLQSPSFSQLASGHNIDVSITNTNDLFARDLNFGKTVMFEFGIRHAFSPDMVLDISAYNKDALSNIAGRILPSYDPLTAKVGNLNMWTNADFGNARGIDVKLDRRIGSIFQGTLVYSYQSNLTTGSDPNEYISLISRGTSNVLGDRVPPPQALMVSGENRYHTIAGNLAFNFPHGWHSGTALGTVLQDVGLNATFRFASGLPYTPILVNSGSGWQGPHNGLEGAVTVGTETWNSATMPWIKNVDLRVTRGFEVGGRSLTVFADFRNLFNWTNLTNIWAETGGVVNDVYQTRSMTGTYTALYSEAGSLWHAQPVTKNGVTTTMNAMDLTDCSQYAPTRYYGVPNCIMLRRTEARFGNGDGILDQDELDATFNALYNAGNGPWTLQGAGLNIRFGFELNF
jgi:hypothetical protein